MIETGLPLDVAFCAGVGQGMSFEVELAKRGGRPVVVMDPSPTGIATAAATAWDNLEFLPVGIAASCGVLSFSVPKDPGEGSYSVARDGLRTVHFECWDLPYLMARSGVRGIDLLKMDVEGFEYGIVQKILDERIPVRQLCVEFHPWLAPGQTYRTIARLYRAGYRIVHKHRGDHTFVLDEARFARLLERSQVPVEGPVAVGAQG